MEAWEKFADELKLTEDLEETYYNLRKFFQKEGWSNEDLAKPPYYTEDLMDLFHRFSRQRDRIFTTISSYGFIVDNLVLSNYIRSRLQIIDEMTPLKE